MVFTILGSLRATRRRPSYVRALFYSSEPEASVSTVGKVVNVAIIGAPNSGKSTLINKIVERKICPTSNKVHTTTKLARAMCFHNYTQIVFLDTPGIVSEKEQKKYNLPNTMIEACHKSLRCADVVGVVHDVANRWTRDRIHNDAVTMLSLIEDIPSFLILNKNSQHAGAVKVNKAWRGQKNVDQLKSKKQLLTVIRKLTNGRIAGNPIPGVRRDRTTPIEESGYSKFSDVFLVSALKGDGVTDVKEYLLNNAKPANFQYAPEDWTDQRPEALIVESVRAIFLDFLSQEIPYNLKPVLEYFEEKEEGGRIVCVVSVECPSERLVRLISGAGGGRLQQMKSLLRENLTEMFKRPVSIDVVMKVNRALSE